MKFAAYAMMGLVLATGSGVAGAEEAIKLETDIQRISYAFGLDFGAYVKGMQLMDEPFDLAAVQQGIKDAYTEGAEPLMTMEDVQKAQQIYVKKKSGEVDKNKEAAAKFLKENGEKEGVKTTESGLQYKVIKEGTGASPKADDMVKVHYKGTLMDGTEFDSSHKRGEPATFKINQVIPGWTEGLQLMKEGGVAELYLDPKLAYGDNGAGPLIKPGSLLIFNVELLEVVKTEEKPADKAEEKPAEEAEEKKAE